MVIKQQTFLTFCTKKWERFKILLLGSDIVADFWTLPQRWEVTIFITRKLESSRFLLIATMMRELFKLSLVEVNKAVLQKSAVDFLQLWHLINEPAVLWQMQNTFSFWCCSGMPGPLSSSDYGTPYELIDWCFNILDIKTFSPFSCQENLSGTIID